MSLLSAVERFVADEVAPNVAGWDREDVLPAAAERRLLDLGLHGAMVPAEHGGAGLSVAELVPVWRELLRGWISLAGAINPSGLATALLVRHGSEAQRGRWLPALAAGRVGLLREHTHAQLRIGEIRVRMLAAESLVARAAAAVDASAPEARTLPTAAKLFASEAAVWAVEQAARLAASRSYAAGDELARLRRDAPQTQIGEGANDALFLALGREVLDRPS